MIDTIKLLIPIQEPILIQKLQGTLTRFRKENLKDGKLEWEFFTANIEVGSFSRKITIKSTDNPSGFFVELSVPKYVKGNNVEMLNPRDLVPALEALYKEICEHMDYELPHFSTWPVYRLDVCYNWLFESIEQTEYVMDFIQRIDYPRKQRYEYQTSVMYKGSAYTIKFYLKGPEFRKNDFKKLPYERATFLQQWANRIVRFEVNFKRAYLESHFGLSKVYAKDVADNDVVQDILVFYLDRVFRYINPTTMTSAEVIERLQSLFTKGKALRLYQFYKAYYLDDELKGLYLRGGLERTTIYRYKRDLKKAGIGLALESNPEHVSILEQLVIPSPTAKFDLLDNDDYS